MEFDKISQHPPPQHQAHADEEEELDLLPQLDETVSDPRAVIRRLILTGVGLFFFMIATAVAAVLKLWPVAPYYQSTPIRISLLDYLQAIRLSQTAAGQAAAGNYQLALRSYALALENYPAYLEAARRFIETAAESRGKLPLSEERLESLIHWALRQTGTNQTVLAATVRMLDRADLSDMLLRFLDQTRMASEFAAYYAKALFMKGEFEAAVDWFKKLPDRPLEDPVLELYRLAYLAGWGPYEKRDEAKHRLFQAVSNSPYGLLAKRLLLNVSRARAEPELFAQTLRVLSSAGVDDFMDHLAYLDTLIRSGDLNAARQYAKNFPKKPEHGDEVTFLAVRFIELGLFREAQRFIERHTYVRDFLTPEAAYRYWAVYGAVLATQRQSRMLLEVGDLLLHEWPPNTGVYSLALLYNAVGHHLLGHYEEAQAFFDRIAASPIVDDPDSAIRLAKSIIQIGYPEAALSLLRVIEARKNDDFDYWFTRFKAGWAYGKDPNELLHSSQRLLETARARSNLYQTIQLDYALENQLNTDERILIALNNRAATLLLLQTNIDEAVAITFEALLDHPGNPALKANHAFGLALIGRTDDAERMLRSIPEVNEGEVYNTSIQTAALIAARKGDRLGVEKALARLRMNDLTAIESLWIKQWQERLKSGVLLPPPISKLLTQLTTSNPKRPPVKSAPTHSG